MTLLPADPQRQPTPLTYANMHLLQHISGSQDLEQNAAMLPQLLLALQGQIQTVNPVFAAYNYNTGDVFTVNNTVIKPVSLLASNAATVDPTNGTITTSAAGTYAIEAVASFHDNSTPDANAANPIYFDNPSVALFVNGVFKEVAYQSTVALIDKPVIDFGASTLAFTTHDTIDSIAVLTTIIKLQRADVLDLRFYLGQQGHPAVVKAARLRVFKLR